MTYLYLWLIALPLLGVLDALWIGVIARSYYKAELGPLLSSDVVWPAAIGFYLLYTAGLVFFVIAPAFEARSLMFALLAGAFFGLVAYGTYDLTNLATTTGWPAMMSFVDMAWGAAAGAVVSGLTYWVATILLP